MIPRPPLAAFATKEHWAGNNSQRVSAAEQLVYPINYQVVGGKTYGFFPKEGGELEYRDFWLTDDQNNLVNIVKPHEQEGMFTYYVGLLHPKKGFVYPEALAACNIAKRYLLSTLKFFATPSLALPYLAILILPWRLKVKIIEKLLLSYNTTCDVILEPHFLDDQYMMLPARQLRDWIARFLVNLGVSDGTAKRFGLTVATLFEYDCRYMETFQDVMSEASKEVLVARPSRELTRLFGIFAQREKLSKKLLQNVALVGRVFKIIFFHPRIRKAFAQSVKDVDFQKIGLSEADKYWALFEYGYDFMGIPYDERQDRLSKLHQGKIPVGERISSKPPLLPQSVDHVGNQQ